MEKRHDHIEKLEDLEILDFEELKKTTSEDDLVFAITCDCVCPH